MAVWGGEGEGGHRWGGGEGDEQVCDEGGQETEQRAGGAEGAEQDEAKRERRELPHYG